VQYASTELLDSQKKELKIIEAMADNINKSFPGPAIPLCFFCCTLVPGPKRSLSLDLSYTRVYEPSSLVLSSLELSAKTVNEPLTRATSPLSSVCVEVETVECMAFW
jgi:hypothetical protein